MSHVILGVAVIFAAMWFMCTAMADWDWVGAFLYVLGAFAVFAVMAVGVALVVSGLSA